MGLSRVLSWEKWRDGIVGVQDGRGNTVDADDVIGSQVAIRPHLWWMLVQHKLQLPLYTTE